MRLRILPLLAALWLALTGPAFAESADPREEAGVWIGLTLGNLVFVPMRLVSVASGAAFGALSFVLMGGDAEVTRQVWQDTFSAPNAITPELARAAIGARPEHEARE
ncbi:MAG TPA: hypothetical protein VNL14_10200 [Candidatus Acidoferrales bacterium]|nr:hypothetical protein [Candidatus Acidoferrales bacterium]